MTRKDTCIIAVLFIFSLVITALTVKDYGVASDEPKWFHFSELQLNWLGELKDAIAEGNLSHALSEETIAKYWRPDYHPPFARILSSLSWLMFHRITGNIIAYRLHSVFLFATLVALIYAFMSKIYDRMAGLFSSLSTLLIPGFFGYAHLASPDMVLTTMWFLSVYSFLEGLKSWKWSLVFAVTFGLAMATKIYAIVLMVPVLIWAHLFHRKEYANNVFGAIFISPLVLFLSYPRWWHNGLPKLLNFVFQNVNRREIMHIPTYYFHKTYHFSLPWHYPFLITALSVPVTILITILIGMGKVAKERFRDRLSVLLLANAFVLQLASTSPLTPSYDGIRLFLPAFPFLACLAGIGFMCLSSFISKVMGEIGFFRLVRNLKGKVFFLLIVIVMVPAAIDLLRIHPYELSYFNELIGGVRGAERAGLEVTCLKEVVNRRVMDYLNSELPNKATIYPWFSLEEFYYYESEGMLRDDIQLTDTLPADYFILVCRKGWFSEREWWLYSESHPVYSVKYDGVPLLLIYRLRWD